MHDSYQYIIAQKNQANGWTALFFAMEAQKQVVLEYLLETRRVNVMHEDDVRINSLVL